MATAKLLLDKRRKNPALIKEGIDNNRYPVKIRIYKGDENTEITLKYKFKPSEWNEEDNKVDKSYQGYLRANSAILTRYSVVNAALMNYQSIIKSMEMHSIKKLIETEIEKHMTPTDLESQAQILSALHESKSVSLEKFANKLNERNSKKGKHGTVNWYEDAIRSVKKFNDNKDLSITNITVSFLEDFEAFHLSIGNSKNTVSSYLRAIRAITNYAIKEELKGKRFENYPWGTGGYSIPSTKTEKRAVKKNVIDNLRRLELDPQTALWDAHNYFFWMYNNRGMNLIDLAKLQKNQIVDAIYENGIISGRLKYVRSKNGKPFDIRLTKESLRILNLYRICDKSPEEFIFPIGFDNTKKGLENYRQNRKRINARFKELARQIGEPDLNLTTYVIRHSWATIAKKEFGVSTDLISEGLGHNDVKTTQTYLEEFDETVLDDLNEMIVSA